MSRPLRIAVANWTSRMAGGAEQYVRDVVPELQRQGHVVSLVHEVDEPRDRTAIVGPAFKSWSVAVEGEEAVIRGLHQWQPDVIFVQALGDPGFEQALQSIAPAVLLAHGYYGTCISGEKLWKNPHYKTCSKPFGPACLLHYYPHRCGGLNPLTMVHLYGLQRARNRMFARYASIVTLSEQMRGEVERSGGRAVHVPLLASGESVEAPVSSRDSSAWRLLFVGRMTGLKGGELLLDSLPILRRSLSTSIDTTFVGDGPQRARWAAAAANLMKDDPWLRIRFTGWLEGEALDRQWRSADLYVMPSIWPEPLGLSGADAAAYSIPTVAFRVGGIPEWLIERENGCLAEADPPAAEKLATAILRALDSQRYDALRASTGRHGLHVALARHVRELHVILAQAADIQGL